MAWRVISLTALILGLCGMPAGRVPAQPPEQPATRPDIGPSWLRVTADAVLLRSRADANSVPVMRVERGTLLQAVSRDAYNWYRVRPPPEVFSYVSAELVDRRSLTEGIVSVRSGRLRVRVGSLLSELDPERSEVQTLLELGTPVRIVGEQGSWLKIAAPDGVYLYVQGSLVEPVSTAAASQPPRADVGRPASAPAAPIAAASAPSSLTFRATIDASELEGPWGRRLVALEGRIAAEARKPLVDQDWTAALEELAPLAQQRTEPAVARLAAAWIAQLQQRSAERELVRSADEVLSRTARDQARYQREQQQLVAAREAVSRAVWDARGQLLRTYAAKPPAGRRWYRLQDPLTDRVLVYVEIPANSPLDAERLIGQYVGVRGRRRTEASLGADVIEATALESLTPEQPATRPGPASPAAPARQAT